jgi:hypothetical protein
LSFAWQAVGFSNVSTLAPWSYAHITTTKPHSPVAITGSFPLHNGTVVESKVCGEYADRFVECVTLDKLE